MNVIVIEINSKRKDQHQEKNKMNIRTNRFFLFHDLSCRNRVLFNRRRYI